MQKKGRIQYHEFEVNECTCNRDNLSDIQFSDALNCDSLLDTSHVKVLQLQVKDFA